MKHLQHQRANTTHVCILHELALEVKERQVGVAGIQVHGLAKDGGKLDDRGNRACASVSTRVLAVWWRVEYPERINGAPGPYRY